MSSLPPGWIEATLGDMHVEARPGFPCGQHNSSGRGVAHLRPMNIDRLGRIDLSEVKYVEADRDQRLVQGDVLFNNTNSPALIGKTAYFDRVGAYAFSNHMTRLRPPPGIDPKFLAVQLHAQWDQGVFRRLCSHHVNQASVSTTSLLANVFVRLPPAAEQRRIVAAIEEHVSRLQEADRLLTTASTRLVALDQTTTDALAHVGAPSRALKDLLAEPLSNGRSVRTAEGGFPVLRLSALKRGTVDIAESKPGSWTEQEARPWLIREGDFLVVRGNGSLGLVGRGGLVEGSPPPVAYPDTVIRVRVREQVVRRRYLRLLWDTAPIRAQLESQARTTAGIYKINQQHLLALRIPVPSMESQDLLIAEAEERMSIIDAMRRSIAAAQRRSSALRRSILERALRGELVPQDPSDEPATVLLDRIQAERAKAPSRRRSRPRAGSAPAA